MLYEQHLSIAMVIVSQSSSCSLNLLFVGVAWHMTVVNADLLFCNFGLSRFLLFFCAVCSSLVVLEVVLEAFHYSAFCVRSFLIVFQTFVRSFLIVFQTFELLFYHFHRV